MWHKGNLNNRPMRQTVLVATVALTMVVVIAVGTVVASGTFTIPRSVISSGGGQSSSDRFTLEGSIGQTAVGLGASDNHTLDAGFLSGVPRVDDPRCVYDVNFSGTIERTEAVQAVTDYLLGLTDITREDVIIVVTAYLLRQTFDC